MPNFDQKTLAIKEACLKETSSDPVEIALHLMRLEIINMHGPEHHMLDGAAFLSAYHNAGGDFDLGSALDQLALRSASMPGAMCGYWGVCGSASSVGAALSIIHHSGPLSSDSFYRDNMEFTSLALSKIGKIGGPRCCKRNAFISLTTGAAFAKEKYGIALEVKPFSCEFFSRNPDCLEARCPYHPK
jgi:hypothetical protein